MAIARPRLGAMSAAQESMLGHIRRRVARWDEIAAFNGDDGDGPIQPFYNLDGAGTTNRDAMATEAVLNALVLTHADPRGPDGTLSEPTQRALAILWSTQNERGSWNWLNFNLRPWEKDAEYLGAAWAAMAIGKAGEAYVEGLSDADRAKLDRLRAYLDERYDQESLHNRLAALWAATLLDGVLDAPRRQALIDETLAVEGEADGWALTSLAKRPNNTATWTARHKVPANAAHDGYATAYVVHVLKRAGAAHPKLDRATAWLGQQQVAAGRGPAIYLNKERDPDAPGAMVGRFMHDAAAAHAVLALTHGE
jgi:hypothetical protein